MAESSNSEGRRRFTTLPDRAEILNRFHRSGQTRKRFAESNGIRLSTLSYWLTCEKRKALQSVSTPAVFTEFRLADQSDAQNVKWAMEVESPEGMKVRSREALPASLLLRLLALRRC